MKRELVCYEETHTKVGRSTRFWSLTQQGHAQFADRHDRFSSVLLESAQELFGAEGIEKLICAREDKFYHRYAHKLAEEENHLGKLTRLVRLRQHDGYMAEVLDHPQGMLLLENHCPIGMAAHTCSNLRNSELQLFHRLFGNGYLIERTAHAISRSRHCAYLIQPRER